MNWDRKEFRASPEGKKYRQIGWEVIRVFAICLLMVFVLFRAEAIAGGLSWLLGSMRSVLLGLGFGYILSPLDNNIRRYAYHFFLRHNKSGKMTDEKAKKRARILGVSLSSLFGIGLVITLLVLVIPAFLNSISNISDVVSSNLERLTLWLEEHRENGGMLMGIISKAIDALRDWIENGLADWIAEFSGKLVSMGMEIMSYLLDFLISFFVAIYTLLEKENFSRRAKKILFSFCKPATANQVLDVTRHSNKIFGDFMSGKLIDSLIIGLICFILMSILGIRYAVMVSVVIGVTNIIPFLGPFIGGVPCAAIILLLSPREGIIFIIMFIILQQVDGNIIGPWILGDRTGVSAFWIICSLLFFRTLFGLLGTGMSIVGMIVGVPLFCVIEYLITRRVDDNLKKKEMDPDEVDFHEVAGYSEEDGQFVMLPPEEEKASLRERIKEYFDGVKAKFRKLLGKKKGKKE